MPERPDDHMEDMAHLEEALLRVAPKYRDPLRGYLAGQINLTEAAEQAGVPRTIMYNVLRRLESRVRRPHTIKFERLQNPLHRELEALQKAGWIPGRDVRQTLDECGFDATQYKRIDIARLTSMLIARMGLKTRPLVYHRVWGEIRDAPSIVGIDLILQDTGEQGAPVLVLPWEVLNRLEAKAGDHCEVKMTDRGTLDIKPLVKRCAICRVTEKTRPLGRLGRFAYICVNCYEVLRIGPKWDDAVDNEGRLRIWPIAKYRRPSSRLSGQHMRKRPKPRVIKPVARIQIEEDDDGDSPA